MHAEEMPASRACGIDGPAGLRGLNARRQTPGKARRRLLGQQRLLTQARVRSCLIDAFGGDDDVYALRAVSRPTR
jgi:hypothetical protein